MHMLHYVLHMQDYSVVEDYNDVIFYYNLFSSLEYVNITLC